MDNNIILFWRVTSFEDLDGFDKYKPGEIIKFYTIQNKFLVKCKTGAVLVKDCLSEMPLNTDSECKKLKSANFKELMNEILNRHYSVYETSKCNEKIESLRDVFVL